MTDKDARIVELEHAMEYAAAHARVAISGLKKRIADLQDSEQRACDRTHEVEAELSSAEARVAELEQALQRYGALDRVLMLDQGDVTIEDYEPLRCEECMDEPVAKVVYLDVRSLGQTLAIGCYCAECAAEVAQGVRDGLPAKEEVG